ncbi:glycosyltransferase family 39 protein [Candidatus Sumerlaeota bacterium]|nr:glycosyltransferase family 39 protein [Candidatus Sumerlaeota bacterium]
MSERIEPTPIRPWEWITVMILMVVGGAFRLWCAARTPGLWYDEAINGLDALDLVRKAGYWPIFFSTEGHMREPLYLYLQGVTLSLAKPSAFAIRATSAVVGTLTIPIVWAAAREYRGALFAAFVAFLFTFLRWHVHFSALAFRTITAPFFCALVLWFALRLTRTWTLRDAILLGVFLGAGMYTYLAFRLIPFAVALFLLIEILRVKGIERVRNFKMSAIAGLVSLIVFAPLGIDYIRNPDHFTGRSGEVSIFDREDWTSLLARQTRDIALTPLLRGDHVGKHNLPGARRFLQLFDQDPIRTTEVWDMERPIQGAKPFDPHGTGVPLFGIAGGLLFYVGLAGSVRAVTRDLRARLLLIVLCVGLIASILSFGAPNILRLLLLSPVCTILLADGFMFFTHALIRWEERVGLRSGAWIGKALIAIIVGNALFFHTWTEVRRMIAWPSHPMVRREFNVELADLAKYLAKQPDRIPVRIPPKLMNDEGNAHATLHFIADGYTFNPPDDKLGDRWWEFRTTGPPFPPLEEKGVQIPGGRFESIYHPAGVLMGVVVEVGPGRAVQASQ